LTASNIISNTVTYTKYVPMKFHFHCQNLIL